MTVLSGAGLIAGFVVVLFVVSLIHFSLKESGVFALPEFGGEGMREFFFTLPWLSIAVVLVAALALEFWLLRYAFAYRRPLLYSVFGIAVFLTLGTVLVSVAKVQEGVYQAAETTSVPIVRPLYHSFVSVEPPNLRKGMVAELEEHGFLLRGRGGKIVNVTVTKETRIAPPVAVQVGDMVIVFGQNADGSFRAIGVKHVQPGMVFVQETRR